MRRLLENGNIVSLFVPVDLQDGANTGDWISVANYEHVALVFFAAAGTAGDDPTITVIQASDNSGTGSKALNFTDVYTKTGTLTSTGTFTKNEVASGNTYTDATSAETQKIWVVEFDSDQLDVDNDFDHVSMTVADVGGNAQIGCAFAILTHPSHAQEVNVSPL